MHSFFQMVDAAQRSPKKIQETYFVLFNPSFLNLIQPKSINLPRQRRISYTWPMGSAICSWPLQRAVEDRRPANRWRLCGLFGGDSGGLGLHSNHDDTSPNLWLLVCFVFEILSYLKHISQFGFVFKVKTPRMVQQAAVLFLVPGNSMGIRGWWPKLPLHKLWQGRPPSIDVTWF